MKVFFPSFPDRAWDSTVLFHSRSCDWPNNDRSSKSSGPSFLTLFTSGEAGLTTKRSSGAGARRRLSERGTRLAQIHPVGRAGLVENNRHAVVNRLDRSIGGRCNNGERRLPLTGLDLPCFEESGEEE